MLLANKYTRGVILSDAEQAEIKRLVSSGVLEHRGLAHTLQSPSRFISPLRLTERAIKEEVLH
jgi:hypothetical protein